MTASQVSKQFLGFPAKAGTHFSASEPVEIWVPAFAGKPSLVVVERQLGTQK